jgi:hypothetical protein
MPIAYHEVNRSFGQLKSEGQPHIGSQVAGVADPVVAPAGQNTLSALTLNLPTLMELPTVSGEIGEVLLIQNHLFVGV